MISLNCSHIVLKFIVYIVLVVLADAIRKLAASGEGIGLALYMEEYGFPGLQLGDDTIVIFCYILGPNMHCNIVSSV